MYIYIGSSKLGFYVFYQTPAFKALVLTHCGLPIPYGFPDLCHHWFRWWLVVGFAAKSLSEPMQTYYEIAPGRFKSKQIFISFKEVYLEMRSVICWPCYWGLKVLTHWRRETYICISKLTIIGSDNGLLPVRHQAIIWTSAGFLLILTLGTNFSEILSEIHIFSFMNMHLKMLSGKWRPFCPGGDELSL